MDSACETPIVELLERVPAAAQTMYEHSSTSHQNIPFGAHAKRAVEEIRSLQSKLDSTEKLLKEMCGHFKRRDARAIELESKLDSALERMERARSILRKNPAEFHNWGMLDTSDLREPVVEKP